MHGQTAVREGTHTLYCAAVFRGKEGGAPTHLGLLNILNRYIVALGVVKGAGVGSGPRSPELTKEPRHRSQETLNHSILDGVGDPSRVQGTLPGCRGPRGLGSPSSLRVASSRNWT